MSAVAIAVVIFGLVRRVWEMGCLELKISLLKRKKRSSKQNFRSVKGVISVSSSSSSSKFVKGKSCNALLQHSLHTTVIKNLRWRLAEERQEETLISVANIPLPNTSSSVAHEQITPRV